MRGIMAAQRRSTRNTEETALSSEELASGLLPRLFPVVLNALFSPHPVSGCQQKRNSFKKCGRGNYLPNTTSAKISPELQAWLPRASCFLTLSPSNHLRLSTPPTKFMAFPVKTHSRGSELLFVITWWETAWLHSSPWLSLHVLLLACLRDRNQEGTDAVFLA